MKGKCKEHPDAPHGFNRDVWVNLYPNENRLCYYYDTEEEAEEEAEEASSHKRIGNRAWPLEIEE